MKYRAIYSVTSEVAVDIEVPEEVVTHLEGDELGIEDWVAEKSHALATEHVRTWGIHGPVTLSMSLDGIGAETIDRSDA